MVKWDRGYLHKSIGFAFAIRYHMVTVRTT